MEIRNLLSFVSAAESGSMANAARVCHITPSAVCKHIKDLECELGVLLLVRGKNSVKLTDYGEVFFLRAKNIIRETQKAKEEIADVKGELCGELRIGVGCFVETMIGRAIAEFMNRYPKVRICVQYNYAHELNRMLRSNEIDVAFSMNEPYSNEGIESVKCFQFRLYAIMSKNHMLSKLKNVTIDDTKNCRVILPDAGKRELATIQRYVKDDISLIMENSCCICNNANAILNGLSVLDAITFLPKEYVINRSNLIAKKVEGLDMVFSSNAHWLKNKPMSASAMALLRIIESQMS